MTVLADIAPLAAPSGEAAKSGPIGLAVILVLIIVCYFLFKSMSRHMRRVRETFPGQEQPSDAPAKPVRPTRASVAAAQQRAAAEREIEASERPDSPGAND